MALGVVFIFLSQQNQAPAETTDRGCGLDSDCVVRAMPDPKNPCCSTCESYAISKESEEKRQEWWAENCQDAQCPVFDCYNEKLSIPRCINSKCAIKWKERGYVE